LEVMLSILAAFLLSCFLQWVYITRISKHPLFQRKSQIEANKKQCIQELHKSKADIPTMGGMAMAVSYLCVIAVGHCWTKSIGVIPFILILYALLGLLDDFIKIKQLRDGITPLEKMCGIILISIFVVGVTEGWGDIGQVIWLLFLYALGCNSVNLTDGIDGLAPGICGIVFAALTAIAYHRGIGDMVWLSGVMCAICMGTLLWNFAPAKVFMGDTGSLFLGGAIVYIAYNLEILPWVAVLLLVCIWEVVSVILQLTSIRFRKKKVFLIAPYHHHLEKRGWPEAKIDYVMWGITLILSVAAVVLV